MPSHSSSTDYEHYRSSTNNIQRTLVGLNSNFAFTHHVYSLYPWQKNQLKMLCKLTYQIYLFTKRQYSHPQQLWNRIWKHHTEQGMWPSRHPNNIVKPISPQGNSRIENVHQFLKRTLTKLLESSNLAWGELLPFACYCYNIFPGSNRTKTPFFLMFGHEPMEGWLAYINNCSRYYGDNKGKIVLNELPKLWKHHTT